ncbi:hypothetical protein APHAL10511_000556 [Amanita phalloides]|nr:hypothetical protein APHAL10511_000556 [Amanita phalloides]
MSSSYANTKSTARAQAIFVAGDLSLFSGGPRPRHEYCIALKEVYTPYFNLTKLKTMFEALRDTIILLRTVWSKGFTDRDISVANVSWDEKSKCVMLMDLDLLAHADSTMIRRIGTPHFMATELYEGQYLFKAEEDKPPTPEVGVNTQNSKLSFRYNPIHDLESVWWLAVWTLFNHAPKSEVTKPDIKSGGGLMKLYQQKCIYERTFTQSPTLGAPTIGAAPAR